MGSWQQDFRDSGRRPQTSKNSTVVSITIRNSRNRWLRLERFGIGKRLAPPVEIGSVEVPGLDFLHQRVVKPHALGQFDYALVLADGV